VDPDPGFLVAVSDEEYVAKLEARRDAEVIRAMEGESRRCAEVEWIRSTLKDEQLARSIEIMQDQLDGKGWPAPDPGESSARLALEQELRRGQEARTRVLAQVERIEERIAQIERELVEVGEREAEGEKEEREGGEEEEKHSPQRH
jgi:hypothetical protein